MLTDLVANMQERTDMLFDSRFTHLSQLLWHPSH